MRIDNIYVGKEVATGKYTLLQVSKTGRIKDMARKKTYSVENSDKFESIDSESSIPISWFACEEDIKTQEVFKIYSGIRKVLRLKGVIK